ncbi:thioesterase family protein [Novosphingobium sp. TH158]|uniref:acyl-CoA thioesterase n=1 Tax=Novosphingobium sp. TH158 TaxID=2067455 RepID=UPI000C7B2104|nr:thioesterase family protein [Novosphingobium sp. TH158]PLK26600.1 thioesterase [Novosphingobium sp. TH158]
MSRQPLLGRDAYRHWQTLPTQWADNDVYGHVNNTVHYRWFDTLVNSWLIAQGLLDIEHGDPIGLVVETGCRYAASLTYPGSVDLGLRLDRLGSSSVTYRIGVFAADSAEPAAEGHFSHVYVGRESRRPVPLPQAWRDRLELLA